MRRRDFAALLCGAVVAPAAPSAQQPPSKMRRVGYLSAGSQSGAPPLLEALRQGLLERGWIDGKNIAMEYRFADGHYDRLPAMAQELMRLNIDVFAASPTPAVVAARNATTTLPIIGISFDNPVENGLVESLARPGGNVTGIAYSAGPQIFGKDLELLQLLEPGIRKIAVLSNSSLSNPNQALMARNVNAAAVSLGVTLLVLDARGPQDFEAAFADMKRAEVGALFVFGDPMFGVHRERLAELAATARIPTMYTNRGHVEAGGLMCYGPSFRDIWRRSAAYVDQVLKGARPADLPVEQPTQFELVINLRTAKALGLTIPPALLARADEVIE